MDTPNIDELDRLRTEVEVEERFWREHQSEFDENYHHRFVAAMDGMVLDADPHLIDLAARLRARGIDIRDTWLKFIGLDYSRLTL